MAQPLAKRSRRRADCPCPACEGRERDVRTVERHMCLFFGDMDPSIPGGSSTALPSTSSMPPTSEPDHVDVNEGVEGNDSQYPSPIVEPQPTVSFADIIPDHKIIDFVMREVATKLNYGSSQSEIEQHLSNASLLLNSDSRIPTTWSSVLKLLKKYGYQDPKRYKVCVSKTHSFLLKSPAKHPQCPFCQTPWAQCIDYYVLGLGVENWFVTENQCTKLMAHWEERDSWFRKPEATPPTTLSELWHGSRFRELSYFWDKEKTYLLPDKCVHCSTIISSDEIKAKLGSTFDLATPIDITCRTCASTISVLPKCASGDPRNQAVIIHEDGWAPHSTSSRHSVATITISHATMTKLERSDSRNARVYSFIPVDGLPTDTPHKLDAFLQPLFEELEDLFIEGLEVLFHSEVPDHSPANDIARIRVIPLLATADAKAHAEIGQTSSGGKKGCRRCNVVGKLIESRNHYYYGNFLYRYRYPVSPRLAEESRSHGRLVDQASSVTQRHQLSKEYGVTGESLFYRLYDLCGFDPVYDLVIDAMHAVVLNLIRSELEYRLLAEDGVLDRKDLAEALGYVNWTTELKDGRLPYISQSYDRQGKHRLGNWKSEEFSKFAIVAPYVLHSLIPNPAYECFLLLTRIHQLIFSKQLRIEGWTVSDRDLLESLLWRHAILYERLYGLSACTENVEYSHHLPDDVSRHSTPDNYWCYLYERLVRHYKQQTTNQKQLCKTYSDRECQLQFVQDYFATHTEGKQKEDDPPELHEDPVLLVRKTADEAFSLKDQLCQQEMPAPLRRLYQSGILIGSSKFITLSSRQHRDIIHWIQKESTVTEAEIPSTACSYTRILKSNALDMAAVYKIGEYVILHDSEVEGREWVMEVLGFLTCGPVLGKYYLFVDGHYFVAKSNRGSIDYDDWTKQPKMVARHFERLRVQPMSLIKRKVMLYPDPSNKDTPSFYLVIDPDMVDSEPVKVPHYPEPDEVVKVDEKLLYVMSVDCEEQKARGRLLKPIGGGNPRWKLDGPEITVDFMSIEKHLQPSRIITRVL